MRFSKWHALGNSYLVVERADHGRALTAHNARKLCDVRYGIGSDGVLEIVSARRTRAEVLIWNPDGSLAEFSGNGSRIAAAWLAGRSGADDVELAIGGRTYRASMNGATVSIDVGAVEVRETETIALEAERIELTPVSVGNPHAVVRRRAPDRGDLLRLGPAIERHPRFPNRTNVQLVGVDGLRALTVLVWERGAGETTSSGSSAVAAAAAAVANGWCESPVTVHLPGGDLEVSVDDDNLAVLRGPAEEIARGDVLL